MPAPLDARVIGSGPNGLAAAITLARAGLKVQVYERHAQVGGGLSSGALTLPGFMHDLGSAVHPLGAASPGFREWPLHAFGLDWVHSPSTFAHPLDEGAVLQDRSLDVTAAALGPDGPTYRDLVGPLLPHWADLLNDILRPLVRVPRHPFTLARFGLRAVQSAALIATRFRTEQARALWGGVAAHAGLNLSTPASAAPGLVLLLMGHAVGWPFPRGGAGAFAEALSAYLTFLGGEVVTGVQVNSLDALPPARVTLVDSGPAELARLLGGPAGDFITHRARHYGYGPGSFKLDYALSGPIPWRDPRVGRAATVHLGGTWEEVAGAEARVARGTSAPSPYVLVTQPSLFDPTRAPPGQHTLWAYTHVPNGSAGDATAAIERQLERFAPGWRDLVLARHATAAPALQAFSPTFMGGDVNGGSSSLWGLLARPWPSVTPYRSGVPGVYLCSASTPPGGGVHGMAGHHAALTALRDHFPGAR